MSAKKNETPEQILAWQGLQIPMQEEWRPLRIEGTHENGSITIGDINGPIFQLRWLRPPKKDYDGEAWIKERQKEVAGGQSSPNPPHVKGFTHVAWIESLSVRQESKKTVWWGCPKNGEVLVEILLTNLAPAATNRWFFKRALPKLRVLPNSEESSWQIYSARFKVPAGYVLKRNRLAAGDIALEFSHPKKQRLLVRQVYPAGLALQRRSFPGWLEDRVFTEHRRLKMKEEERDENRRMKLKGMKNFPFPLGWVFPRKCESLIVQDQDLDRLMIAEGDWREGTTPPKVEEIVTAMSWSA